MEKTCGAMTEEQPCDLKPCKAKCTTKGDWFPKSACTKQCGSGVQVWGKVLACTCPEDNSIGCNDCKQENMQATCNKLQVLSEKEDPCNTQACRPCKWGDWVWDNGVSQCPACGSPTLIKRREVEQQPDPGGQLCEGNAVEEQKCPTTVAPCVADCKVNDVSSQCKNGTKVVTCGGGEITTFSNVVCTCANSDDAACQTSCLEANKYLTCGVAKLKTEKCAETTCPQDCVVSGWTARSPCMAKATSSNKALRVGTVPSATKP
eukprot:402613_1